MGHVPRVNEVKRVKTESKRKLLLGLAVLRAVIGVIAIPLAPALYRDHFVALVLLRPTKEVLLAAGFLIRRGDVHPLPVVLAAIPILVFGVWQFFWLGRAYRKEIQEGEGLPKWADRILPPKRIQQLCGVLNDRGKPVIVGGRLAAFPSSLLAAAAGASSLKPKEFLPADGLGAALSIVEVVLAGYLLGAAYKQAGPWVTLAGAIVLLSLMVYVGRALKRTPAKGRPTNANTEAPAPAAVS